MQNPEAPKPDRSGGWTGREAPPFVLRDCDGRRAVLADVWQKRPVVLLFYRGKWSEACVRQLKALAREKREFARSGAAVYAIANETPKAQIELRRKTGSDFVLFLSDTNGEAAKRYAGTQGAENIAYPAVFVVRRGRIIYADLPGATDPRTPASEILSALKR